MIKINKPPQSPPKLKLNHLAFLKLFTQYGRKENIPENEFNKYITKYNTPEVKYALFPCSFKKCAYCESIPDASSLEIDHFEPQKFSPEKILEWDNLLPCCRRCNGSKSSYDTRIELIINPAKVDPSDFFTFSLFLMIPRNELNPSDFKLAQNTIKICNLNHDQLITARANLGKRFTAYQVRLKEKLLLFNEEDISELAKTKRKNKLKEAIEIIEKSGGKTNKFSSFYHFYLEKHEEYHEATILVNS